MLGRNKTEWAFHWSFERLVEWAQTFDEKLYLWRFSLREDLPHWVAPKCLSKFLRDVVDHYRAEMPLQGLRVTEMHKSRRIHWHAVVNKRIPIGLVDRIGARYGLGYSWVEQVRSVDRSRDYLSKYLGKGAFAKFDCRIRRWGTIGGFEGQTVKGVRYDSPAHRFLKRVQLEIGPVPFEQIGRFFSCRHIGDRASEDYLIWYWLHVSSGDWAALDWPVWYMQQELAGVGDRDLDGLVPF